MTWLGIVVILIEAIWSVLKKVFDCSSSCSLVLSATIRMMSFYSKLSKRSQLEVWCTFFLFIVWLYVKIIAECLKSKTKFSFMSMKFVVTFLGMKKSKMSGIFLIFLGQHVGLPKRDCHGLVLCLITINVHIVAKYWSNIYQCC